MTKVELHETEEKAKLMRYWRKLFDDLVSDLLGLWAEEKVG